MSDQQCSRLSWADPVGQAQQVFRLALTALSRPAQAHAFVPCPADTAADELPAGLSPELAALALSLCDNETTVWLAPGLDTEDVKRCLTCAASIRERLNTRIAPRPSALAE